VSFPSAVEVAIMLEFNGKGANISGRWSSGADCLQDSRAMEIRQKRGVCNASQKLPVDFSEPKPVIWVS
jgi:hypothetical protein